MKKFRSVFEELVLSSSLRVGLQMLHTRRALLDQNEGLGRPSPEHRATVLEELDRIEALLRAAHSASTASPSLETAAELDLSRR